MYIYTFIRIQKSWNKLLHNDVSAQQDLMDEHKIISNSFISSALQTGASSSGFGDEGLSSLAHYNKLIWSATWI